MFKTSRSEIQEKAYFITRSLKVIDYLRFLSSAHARESLQLYNDRVKTNEVSAVCGYKNLTFVANWQADLAAERNSSRGEF